MTTKTDFVEAIVQRWENYAIFPGVAPACPICQLCHGMEPRQFFSKCRSGEINDEGWFGWNLFDSCGSPIAGQRYTAHAVSQLIPEPPTHLSICEDCLHFHANGDIPENWEG